LVIDVQSIFLHGDLNIIFYYKKYKTLLWQVKSTH
jgi:hypothetical protein